jgi:hypothetical protein
MGKALSIKDTATYELVAELASDTNVSMTQAVKEAVIERLEKVKATRVKEAQAWLERMQSHPPLSDDAWVEPFDPPMPNIDPISLK